MLHHVVTFHATACIRCLSMIVAHAADGYAVHIVHQLGSDVSAALHRLSEHACARRCHKSVLLNTCIDKQIFISTLHLGRSLLAV